MATQVVTVVGAEAGLAPGWYVAAPDEWRRWVWWDEGQGGFHPACFATAYVTRVQAEEVIGARDMGSWMPTALVVRVT